MQDGGDGRPGEEDGGPMRHSSETVDDHYAVLGVSPTATLAAIKESYRRLALTCHPDRQHQPAEQAAKENLFWRVQEAWSVLSDPQARAAYDARRHVSQASELPVGAEVDLDDMDYDEANGIYVYPCRCGHRYEVSENALEQGIETYSCAGCSFVIRIVFQVNNEADDIGP